MYPSPFLRTLESEFRRSKSTNGCSFAIQAVIDDFFWILANSFAAKELAVGFHKKNPCFHRTRFLKNIIESKGPTMPKAEFFCVLLRSLPSVTPEPASRWSACPPVSPCFITSGHQHEGVFKGLDTYDWGKCDMNKIGFSATVYTGEFRPSWTRRK